MNNSPKGRGSSAGASFGPRSRSSTASTPHGTQRVRLGPGRRRTVLQLVADALAEAVSCDDDEAGRNQAQRCGSRPRERGWRTSGARGGSMMVITTKLEEVRREESLVEEEEEGGFPQESLTRELRRLGLRTSSVLSSVCTRRFLWFLLPRARTASSLQSSGRETW